jgi:hypothetical protein
MARTLKKPPVSGRTLFIFGLRRLMFINMLRHSKSPVVGSNLFYSSIGA